MDLPEFGQKLKEARNSRGITLRQLSARCGLSPATLSRFETGHDAGSFFGIKAAFRALGLELFIRECGYRTDDEIRAIEKIFNPGDDVIVIKRDATRMNAATISTVFEFEDGEMCYTVIYNNNKEVDIVFGDDLQEDQDG